MTPKTFIVKVQISQFNSESKTMVLIYNKDRSILYENEATEKIIKEMNGSPKEFWEAELIPDPNSTSEEKTFINLIKKVKFQNW